MLMAEADGSNDKRVSFSAMLKLAGRRSSVRLTRFRTVCRLLGRRETGLWEAGKGGKGSCCHRRASYKAAIGAGATSNKEPGLRPEWRADYFAANIGDSDGYNIEIAHKPWLYK